MDELRVVRREDQSLIVANDAGEEYRLVVDSSVLAELRHLARQTAGGPRINPREIQALVRAGKSRAEITELTGADEDDIERYEEPVLAERRFILESAQKVAVRTSPSEEAEEQFGTVIAERLIGLSADGAEWGSWRDEEAGWMIGLDFESHGVSHRAVWSFEHRKGVLSPLTPDAVTLSKQGEVGDRLIPKLRAVDSSEARDRFDSDAFHPEDLVQTAEQAEDDDEVDDDTSPAPMSAGAEAAVRAGHPSTASIPVVGSDEEFARRREIDQRAINTPTPERPDLGQTADLLDALRRRRGARDEAKLDLFEEDSESSEDPPQPVPLRGVDGESGARRPARPEPPRSEEPVEPEQKSGGHESEADSKPEADPQSEGSGKRGKGRRSIPSWDDILFGTRSEEDPS